MLPARLISIAITVAAMVFTGPAAAGEGLLVRTDDGGTIEHKKAVTGKGKYNESAGEDEEKEAPVSLGLLGMNRKMKKIPDLEPGMNIPLWPIYHQKRNEQEHVTSIVWPLFHSEESRYGDSLTYSFPLFWHGRKKDNSRFTSVFPLFFNTSDGKGNGSLIIAPPLFSRIKRSDKDRQYAFIWPLFGWRDAAEYTQYDFFPVYYRCHETNKLRPFYKERENILGTAFAKPPEFMRDVERDNYFVLFPFFWRFRTTDNTYTHFWPFFGYDTFGRRGRRYSFLFPLYFYKKLPDEGLVSLFLFPFSYARQKITDRFGRKREAKLVDFFPVFQYAKTPTMAGSSILLGTIYDYQENLRKGEGKFSLFLLLYRRHWSRDSASHWYAAPLFRYMRNDKDKWKSFSILAVPYTKRWHMFGVGSKKDDFFLEFHPLFQYKVTNGLSRFNILYGLFGLYKERPEGKPGAEAVRRVRILWFITF